MPDLTQQTTIGGRPARDVIAAYIARDPVYLVNVRSHFGMSKPVALEHLAALEAEGRIVRCPGAVLKWRSANAR